MTLMLAVAPAAPVAGVALAGAVPAAALVAAADDGLEPAAAEGAEPDDGVAVFFEELHALIPRTATPTRTPARTHIGRDTENSFFQGWTNG
jgi:hypothetical protein